MSFEAQLRAEAVERKRRLWGVPGASRNGVHGRPDDGIESRLSDLTAQVEQLTEKLNRVIEAYPELVTLMAGAEKTVTVRRIVEVVLAHTGVSIVDLTSVRRHARIVKARQLVSYLARKHTVCSYTVIGRSLGGKDHTTIMNGAEKIEAHRKINAELDATLTEMERELGLG